ncbi:MAG: hypothetical protein AB1414_15410 [bacterium]
MKKILMCMVVLGLLVGQVSLCLALDDDIASAVGGFGGGPQFGIYYKPNLSKFNDYIKKELGVDGIKEVGFQGGTFRWQLNPNWQIGYNGGWIYGEKEQTVNGKAKFAGLYGGYHGVLVSYKIPQEKLPSKKWDVAVGGGLGFFGVYADLASVDKTTKQPEKYYWMDGDTIGTQLFVEVAYKIAKILSVGGDISYIHAKIDDLKWAGEKLSEPGEIDLSGFLIRVGPRFHF